MKTTTPIQNLQTYELYQGIYEELYASFPSLSKEEIGLMINLHNSLEEYREGYESSSLKGMFNSLYDSE